jgi:RHS repeat-associated protein
MPSWQVRESQVDFRLFDNPLRYTPAYGPAISLELVYQNWRETDLSYYPGNDVNGPFGRQWNCAWNSFMDVDFDGDVYVVAMGARTIYEFSGGSNTSEPDFQDGSRMQLIKNGGNVIIGGRVLKHDGSVVEYTNAYTSDVFFPTALIDPRGQALRFTYDAYQRLDHVTDATGGTTSFTYGDLDGDSDPSNDRVVTQIATPGGYSASFGYESHLDSTGVPGWYLTNITDAAGIASSLAYQSNFALVDWNSKYYWNVHQLTTPYGTTTFDYLGTNVLFYNASDSVVMTAFGCTLVITEPNGGQHLYLQADQGATNPPLPSSFDSGVIPTGLPIGTLDTIRNERNTFYWGPLQLSGIGNTNIESWGWNEFKRARIRHWLTYLEEWDGGHEHFSDTLGWEQAPSPDGVTEGEVTWYDYAGKDGLHPERVGTGTMLPSVKAYVLPDGSTRYEYYEFNSLGKPTLFVETYTKEDGTTGTRTNHFEYAEDGIDLLRQVGPLGEQVLSNRFDNLHELIDTFDAVNQLTSYVYNSHGQLTRISSPSGLTTTNIYFSAGGSIGRLEKTIDLEINRTNTFTYYASGLVQSHIDERGLIRTNYWDGLNRPTGVRYLDSTTTSNRYDRGGTKLLDLTATRDRLGNWTYFDYNGIRQKIAETNANGVVHRYGYCSCGSLLSVTNAWNTSVQEVTTYSYDFQGHRTFELNADGYNVTNTFNGLGQLATKADGNTILSFAYNNQGLLTNTANVYGNERVSVYDIEDRPEYVTDQNEVTVTNTFDAIGRLRTRAYPDGGVEGFAYTSRGLSFYTNQLGFTNSYGYDEARRKTSETNANHEVVRYTFNAAGDLLTLTDGKNQTTTWHYDEFGRVTNKLDQTSTEVLRYSYDPNNRPTNRWSIAKGNTAYSYDNVGNLTFINYPGNSDVSLAYDAMNRRTNMTDSVGTTRWSYTASGQLATEDGPFTSDTITNFYVNRRRIGLTLQQPSGSWTNMFQYDAANRFTNVISPAGTFTYYYATSGVRYRPQRLALPNAAYVTNAFDTSARLTNTTLRSSTGTALDLYTYAYNPGNQRTAVARADTSAVSYSYDSIGQLTDATSTVDTEDRGYTYDTARNMSAYRLGSPGDPLLEDGIAVNSKNEVVSLSELGSFTYDTNGNMVAGVSGDYQFTYDAENRLSSMTTPSDGGMFHYDGLGRLRVRDVYYPDGDDPDTLAFAYSVEYFYDGMRVIQERNGDNNPLVSYTRGPDLSTTMEGAGGIGGLLARSAGVDGGGNFTNHAYYFADGNGNITYMTDQSQSMVAAYRFDPFGNQIGQAGTLGSANVYRFSSKEIMTGGLYYYGYRFYVPWLQRWVNRDPIQETGGLNLYCMDHNNPVDNVDPDGRSAATFFSRATGLKLAGYGLLDFFNPPRLNGGWTSSQCSLVSGPLAFGDGTQSLCTYQCTKPHPCDEAGPPPQYTTIAVQSSGGCPASPDAPAPPSTVPSMGPAPTH